MSSDMEPDRGFEDFLGREETREDSADPERLARLAALLDRDWAPGGQPLPLAHFLYFRPDARQSRLGADGHPRNGGDGILPDAGLPRRMWAGSRIRFAGAIPVGAELTRRSRLVRATPKQGRSGRMVFCTVEHDIHVRGDDQPAIREAQDLVFREAHAGGEVAPRPQIAPEWTPDTSRAMSVDAVQLFRYSALTFNAHRIHYDRAYAREVEGYAGLVVHGPYLATLMFDHLQQACRDRAISEFSFRASSPLFDGEEFTVGSRCEGEDVFLSIVGPMGLAMQGTARLRS